MLIQDPIPTALSNAEGGSADWFAPLRLYEVVVLYATRPATARSWTKVPALNPKIGFGLSPDPDRPGRRRGHKTGDPIDYIPTIQPALLVPFGIKASSV